MVQTLIIWIIIVLKTNINLNSHSPFIRIIGNKPLPAIYICMHLWKSQLFFLARLRLPKKSIGRL